MQKIPTLFVRDWAGDRSRVLPELNPAAAWVLAGEGWPTRKYDGTAVLVRAGELFARYDAKPGRTPPPGFEPVGAPDPETGHHPGWVPLSPQAHTWHIAAWKGKKAIVSQRGDDRVFQEGWPLADGTYELCGPHIGTNPEKFQEETFVRHGCHVLPADTPRDFAGVKAWLAAHAIEGIVWHHRDGRMAKVKRRDFGLPWPV